MKDESSHVKQLETVSQEEPVMQTADSQNQETDPFDRCDYYDARGNEEAAKLIVAGMWASREHCAREVRALAGGKGTP